MQIMDLNFYFHDVAGSTVFFFPLRYHMGQEKN